MTAIISEENGTCETLPPHIKSLICALKHRDLHTQLHSQRVILLAEKIGKACGLSTPELGILRVSAYLHDIGKIGVPDHILFKPSKLNPEEWEIMKSHSEKGEDIARFLGLEHCDAIARAVRQHHEYYNGSGYPDQIAGEKISIFARIISIADAYDAIKESRPYHKERNHQQTMKILYSEKGGKFDPYLFDKFVRIIENNQSIQIICCQPQNCSG